MSKNLVTNIDSIVNDRVKGIIGQNTDANSIVTLYDWESHGTYINSGVQTELIDSINNYEFIIVESVARTPVDYFINSACIPKPLSMGKIESGTNFAGYLLDLYYDQSNYKRILVEFPTDTSIIISYVTNVGPGTSNLLIRNIYGIKAKIPTLPIYSAEETPVATWVDGKTVYRRVVELGKTNWTPSDTFIKIPHNIPIDTVVSYQCMLYNNSGTHTLLPYINKDAYVGNTVDSVNLNITNNTEILGMDIRLTIEYTKK